MATAAERKAENEGTFRNANERLNDGARNVLEGDATGRVPFLCECPRMECMEIVLLTLSEYEQVRSGGERGIAALGHDDPTIERVIDRTDRFLITEKFGVAGEVHQEGDPRA